MALEIHDAELVGAHRHVHARLVAVHQHPQPGGRQLVVRYLVPARVRHVEARVDALQQRMGAVAHPMAVHPPLLAGQWMAVDLIQLLDQRVRGQARAQDARHVVRRPVDDLPQRRPEGLQLERWLGDVGARNDERIQTGLAQVVESGVIGINVSGGLGAARQAGNGKGVNVELHDLVAVADEAHVLLLGYRKGGIRHHVQQPDVELADVLRHGAFQGQDVVAPLA